MTAKWRITLGLIGSVLVTTPVALAVAQPQAAACALITYRGGLDKVAPGILATSEVTMAQRLEFVRLHAAARLRIANTFGVARASPVIVIGSTEALRRLFPASSPYATTVYIPYRSCVVVGPKGHDVDVLAHETLHAEIHNRVGHWKRLTQIPTWFDEGLAMQVDHRERYAWSPESGAVDSSTVKRWTSRSQFFPGTDEQLTRHYAMAREEVRQWLAKPGRQPLYVFLERVRQGARFIAIYDE